MVSNLFVYWLHEFSGLNYYLFRSHINTCNRNDPLNVTLLLTTVGLAAEQDFNRAIGYQ